MHILAHSLFLLLAVPGDPDEAPKIPQQAAPKFASVMSVDLKKGEVILTRSQSAAVPVQVTEQVAQPNGQVVNVTKTILRNVNQVMAITYPLKGSTLQTVSGQKFTGDEMVARLRKGVTIIVSSDGQPLDPAYVRLLSPDALVLIAPPAGQPAPPMPAVKR